MPEKITIDNAVHAIQVISSVISNNKNIALVKQARDTVNKHLPADFKANACVSNALEIDGLDKTKRTTEDKDFYYSTLRFGEGPIADELRKAASFICAWKECRSNKKLKGHPNDHKNLIALFVLETLRNLSGAQIVTSKEGVELLTALSGAIQELTLDEQLVGSKNPDKNNNLKRALLKAKSHISKAKQLAECELYDRASVHYLENIVKANNSLLNELPEYILCMLAQNSVPTSAIAYETLDSNDWQALHNTLLQAIIHRIFGVKNPVADVNEPVAVAAESNTTTEFKQFSQSLDSDNCSALPLSTNDAVFGFITNLAKVTLIEPSLINPAYAKLLSNVPSQQIPSGIAHELISHKSGIKAFSNLLEVLKLVHAMEKLLSAQKMLRDYAKNFGDYGIYIKARDTLTKLLQATVEVLGTLKKKIIDLNSLVNAVREEMSHQSDVRPERRENIRKGNNHLENLKIHIAKCEEEVSLLQTQLQAWTTKLPTEGNAEYATDKLAHELHGVKQVLTNVGINVDLSQIALPAPQSSRPRSVSIFLPKPINTNQAEAAITQLPPSLKPIEHEKNARLLPRLFNYNLLAKDRNDLITVNIVNKKPYFDAMANKFLAFAYDSQKNHVLYTYLKNESHYLKEISKSKNDPVTAANFPALTQLKQTVRSLQEVDKVLASHLPITLTHGNQQEIDTREFVVSARIAIIERTLALYLTSITVLGAKLNEADRTTLLAELNTLDSWCETQKFSRLRQAWWNIFPSKNIELQDKLTASQDKIRQLQQQLKSPIIQIVSLLPDNNNSSNVTPIEIKEETLQTKEVIDQPAVLPVTLSLTKPDTTIVNTASIAPLAATSNQAIVTVGETKEEVLMVEGIGFLSPPTMNHTKNSKENSQALIDYLKRLIEPTRQKELAYLANARYRHAYKAADEAQEMVYQRIIRPAAHFAKQIHSDEQKLPESERLLSQFLDQEIRGTAIFEVEAAKSHKNDCPENGHLGWNNAKYLIRSFGTNEQNQLWTRQEKEFVQQGAIPDSSSLLLTKFGAPFISPVARQKNRPTTTLPPTLPDNRQPITKNNS